MIWKPITRVTWIAAISLFAGCGEDLAEDQFPCGQGSCEIGVEVCIIGGDDMCSTCVPAPDPEAYFAAPTCDALPPANSSEYGDFACVDEGTCSDADGGAVLVCEEIEWGCG